MLIKIVRSLQNDVEQLSRYKARTTPPKRTIFYLYFSIYFNSRRSKRKFQLATERTFLARKARRKITKSRSVLRIKAKYFGKARDGGGGTVTQCWQVIIARVLRLYAPSGRQVATYRYRRSLPLPPVSSRRFAFILEIERDFVVFPDASLGTNVRSVACYESNFSTDLRFLK